MDYNPAVLVENGGVDSSPRNHTHVVPLAKFSTTKHVAIYKYSEHDNPVAIFCAHEYAGKNIVV